MAKRAMPNAFTELVGMTDAVTGVDWTIARISNPTDRPAKGTIRAGFLGRDKVGSAMTRADIATSRRPARRRHLPPRPARHQQLNLSASRQVRRASIAKIGVWSRRGSSGTGSHSRPRAAIISPTSALTW
jgi:hypothetical protein